MHRLAQYHDRPGAELLQLRAGRSARKRTILATSTAPQLVEAMNRAAAVGYTGYCPGAEIPATA